MTIYSTSSGWALAIIRTLKEQGIDYESFLAETGLQFDQISEGNSRISVAQMTKLWGLAVKLTEDESFGLQVGLRISSTTYGLLSTATYAAPSVLAVLETMVKYGRIFTDAATRWIKPLEDGVEFTVLANDNVSNEAFDAGFAGLVKILRDITGVDLVPVSTRLGRSQPDDCQAWYEVFSRDLAFQPGELSYMRFTNEQLALPVFNHNLELFEQCKGLMESALASLRRGPIRTATKVEITKGLQEESTIADVAEKMGVSVQTLRRRLAEESTTYAELVDEVRRELAFRYLLQSELRLYEITSVLGFQNASSFTRACKRWFDKTPSQLRAAR